MATCLKLFSVKLLGVKALADMDTGQMWRLWFSKAGQNLSGPTNPFLPILPNFNADSAQTQQVYQMTSEFCSSWCSWHLGDRGQCHSGCCYSGTHPHSCYPPTFSGKTIKSVFAPLSPSKSEVSWLGDGPRKAILSATWLLSNQKKASQTSTLNSNCHGSCCFWWFKSDSSVFHFYTFFESDRWILRKCKCFHLGEVETLLSIQTENKLENLDINGDGFQQVMSLKKNTTKRKISFQITLTFHPDRDVCATVVATCSKQSG